MSSAHVFNKYNQESNFEHTDLFEHFCLYYKWKNLAKIEIHLNKKRKRTVVNLKISPAQFIMVDLPAYFCLVLFQQKLYGEIVSFFEKILKINFSLAIDTGVETMVFLNMGFDISCLVLALVSYFCVTATMVCIGNHWDAVYRSTGEVRMIIGYSSVWHTRLLCLIILFVRKSFR